jgi:prophage regulatory protein
MEAKQTNTGFIRLPTVLQMYPVSRSRWWAGVASGEYPKPVKLSERCTAWRRCDIDALIDRLSNGGKQ